MEAGVKPVWAGSAGDRYGRGAISSWPIVMILVIGAESHAIVISEAIPATKYTQSVHFTILHNHILSWEVSTILAYQVLVWPGG